MLAGAELLCAHLPSAQVDGRPVDPEPPLVPIAQQQQRGAQALGRPAQMGAAAPAAAARLLHGGGKENAAGVGGNAAVTAAAKSSLVAPNMSAPAAARTAVGPAKPTAALARQPLKTATAAGGSSVGIKRKAGEGFAATMRRTLAALSDDSDDDFQ